MTNPRKRYSAEFKAKVALEAIKEQKTLSELAQQYSVHPNQIVQWKKQLLAGSVDVFSNSSKIRHSKQKTLEAQLYQQIGQLKVELDWLKKKFQS
jgi:transposase-like protein